MSEISSEKKTNPWSFDTSSLPPGHRPDLDKIFFEAKGKECFPELRDLTLEQTFTMPYDEYLRLNLTAAQRYALDLDYCNRHNITPQQVDTYVHEHTKSYKF